MTAAGWERAWTDERRGELDEERRSALAARARFVVELGALARHDHPVVYDLGSAGAEVSTAVAASLEGSVVAVDWNRMALAAVDAAEAPCPVATVLADCTTDDFARAHANRADVVLSLGVVEHHPEPAAVIARHAVVLRPGGTLVLMVPNRRSLVGLSRRFMQVTGKWHVGYQREYSPATASAWCRRARMSVDTCVATTRPSFRSDTRATAALAAIDRRLASHLPAWGWYTWVAATKHLGPA